MLDHQAADDPVERPVPEREALAHTPHVLRATALADGACQLGGGRFEPDDDLGFGGPSHETSSKMALAASEIEHARGALQVRLSEREDLELIFEVCPVRERLAPPDSVALPRTLVRALIRLSVLAGRAGARTPPCQRLAAAS